MATKVWQTDPNFLATLNKMTPRNPRYNGEWRKFYEWYAPTIRDWCEQRLGPGADADEAVADVLIKLFDEKLALYDRTRGRFHSWLHKVVQNCMTDLLRKRSRSSERRQEDLEVLEQLPARASAEEGEDAEVLSRHRLQRLILPVVVRVQQRLSTAVWRAYYETELKGRPIPDVAGELGMTAGAIYTARNRVSRALKEEADKFQAPPATAERPRRRPMPRRQGPPQPSRYQILGELGQGGMGIVYKAHDAVANRVVALKTLLPGLAELPGQAERFLGEVAAMYRLRNPNIVQVLDWGPGNGQPYFAMEHVPGGSLADRLKEEGTVAPRQAAELTGTLAQAVHYAHERGVLHCDLKPGNVLLASDGTPRISDFGLALCLDEGSGPANSPAGTPAYVAPEQASGKGGAVSPATDVYALGAILYECLTGQPPFKAETPVGVILQVLSEEPVSPDLLQAHLPPDLVTISLCCLRKVPALRYASAAALANDLRRFGKGEPISAKRLRPRGR